MAAGTPPYGLWPSPLAPGDLAGDRRLRDVAWDSDGRTLVWLEGRGPRGVLVCQRGADAPRATLAQDSAPPTPLRRARSRLRRGVARPHRRGRLQRR